MNGKRWRMRKKRHDEWANTSVKYVGTALMNPWNLGIIGDEPIKIGRSKLWNLNMTFSGVNTVIKVIRAMMLDASANGGAKRRLIKFERSIMPRKLCNYRTQTRIRSRVSQSSNNAKRATSREPRTGLIKLLRIVLLSLPSRKAH